MKIEFYETVKVKKEIEVTFPIYSKHDVSGDRYSTVIYKRITEEKQGGFKLCEIKVSESSVEIEVTENYKIQDGEADYVLGFNDHESDEEEFEDAFNVAKRMLSECGV